MFIVGKLYAGVLTTRVRAGTKCAIEENKCAFKQGRGRMDQAFAVRQVCAKYPSNGKNLFLVFMDLANAYNMIDWHCMWQMLRPDAFGGRLLKAVQNFDADSKAFVLVGMDLNEWHPVKFGLRQDCVMSL